MFLPRLRCRFESILYLDRNYFDSFFFCWKNVIIINLIFSRPVVWRIKNGIIRGVCTGKWIFLFLMFNSLNCSESYSFVFVLLLFTFNFSYVDVGSYLTVVTEAKKDVKYRRKFDFKCNWQIKFTLFVLCSILEIQQFYKVSRLTSPINSGISPRTKRLKESL